MKIKQWYFELIADPDNQELIGRALSYYDKEYNSSKDRCEIHPYNIEEDMERLSSDIVYYFTILQDIESIVGLYDLLYKRKKREKFIHYFEKYNRSLKSNEAEKYAELDDDVLKYIEMKNFFLHYRNLFMGIIKALDAKNYQLSNLARIKKLTNSL